MLGKFFALILLSLLGAISALASNQDTGYDFVLSGKASSYQVRGNLFADRSLGGWGSSIKLMPQEFGHNGGPEALAWLGGAGLTFAAEIDRINGLAHPAVGLPFVPRRDIQLTWVALTLNACVLTQFRIQPCIGLPLSTAIYLEQDLDGAQWSTLTIKNSHPPLFLSLNSHWEQFYFGVQMSSIRWTPDLGFGGIHLNLLQTEALVGYGF